MFCSFAHLSNKYLLSLYHVLGTWNQYLCDCFLTAGDGQPSAEYLAHDRNSIHISCYCYYYSNITVWGSIDQHCPLYCDYISELWTQDNHISRRKCRNYIYLFQIIVIPQYSSASELGKQVLNSLHFDGKKSFRTWDLLHSLELM